MTIREVYGDVSFSRSDFKVIARSIQHPLDLGHPEQALSALNGLVSESRAIIAASDAKEADVLRQRQQRRSMELYKGLQDTRMLDTEFMKQVAACLGISEQDAEATVEIPTVAL